MAHSIPTMTRPCLNLLHAHLLSLLVTLLFVGMLPEAAAAQTHSDLNIDQPANMTETVRQTMARQLFHGSERAQWRAIVEEAAKQLQQEALILEPQAFGAAVTNAQCDAKQSFFQPHQIAEQRLYLDFIDQVHELELPPRALGEPPRQALAGAMALQEVLTLAGQHRHLLSAADQLVLDEKLSSMAEPMAASAEASLELSLALGQDLERQVSDLQGQPGNTPAARAQTYAIHDALYGKQDVSLRIDMLETGTGPYRDMPEEKRQMMAQSLRKQQRLQSSISTAQDAVQAGQDVAIFLHSVNVISDDDFATVSTGLNIAGESLNILGAAATGNVFGVISGCAQLLTTLFGNEPAPDPGVVRHEQVMAGLNAVLDGQVQILSTLQRLSRQIDEVYNRLHTQTEKLGKVMRATKGLLVDQELKGLRDCRDYHLRAIHYSRLARDPVSGEWRQRLELGYHSYHAMALQFDLLGQTLFRSCQDFLNNTSRDSHLTILSMAGDRGQAERIAQALNQPLDWVQDFHLAEATRTDLMIEIIDEVFKPEFRNIILATMVFTPTTYQSINGMVDAIRTGEAAALAELVAAFRLRDAAREFYNAELLQEMIDAQLFMMPLHLLTQASASRLPAFEEIHTPNYDPLRSFGSTPLARYDHFTLPLRDLQRLSYQALMQHGLYQGGVLLPLFSRLLMSVDGYVAVRDQQPALYQMLAKVARRNPVLHENALKYRVYQALRPDALAEQSQNIERYLQLLKPEYAAWYEQIEREAYELPSDFLHDYFDLIEMPLTSSESQRDIASDHMFVLSEYQGFNTDRYKLGEHGDSTLDPRLGANFYSRQSYWPRDPGEQHGAYVRLPGRQEVREGRLTNLDSVAGLRSGLRQLSAAWQQHYLDLHPDLDDRDRFQRTLWVQTYMEILSEPE